MDIELFEFEALFHAVLDAKDHFTMVELGCGYARWLLFAAGAVKRAHPGMTSTLIGVEADATHFQWATEVSRENDLNARLLHAVVDGVDSEVDFLVLDDPAHQYGQSIIYPWTKTYVEEHGMAFDSTKAPALSLKTLLADVDHVDYIDSDIQGAEADVFEAGADVLDAKVARVFIETHGEILERRLCALFARLGWRCCCNYGPSDQRDLRHLRLRRRSAGVPQSALHEVRQVCLCLTRPISVLVERWAYANAILRCVPRNRFAATGREYWPVKTAAAIYVEKDKPWSSTTSTCRTSAPTQVLVKQFATGVCHSQLHELDRPNPARARRPGPRVHRRRRRQGQGRNARQRRRPRHGHLGAAQPGQAAHAPCRPW